MGARRIELLAMVCAVFQLSCSASAPNRGSHDASVADGTATVQRPSYKAATIRTRASRLIRSTTFRA
jgi:hypothetical protein